MRCMSRFVFTVFFFLGSNPIGSRKTSSTTAILPAIPTALARFCRRSSKTGSLDHWVEISPLASIRPE